MKNSVT